jgi:glutamine cyclotransferase
MNPVRNLVVAVLLWVSSVFFERSAISAPERPTAGVAGTQQALSIPTDTPRYDVTIVKTYPHDPEAFTQGMIFWNGSLYESTGSNNSNSTLRKVDLETGEILKLHVLPREYFGEGLTLWRGKLIQLTWRSGVAFIYDPDSFTKIDEFRYGTEGWGLTHDGRSLIMSDGSAVLHFLDPESYSEIRRVEVRDQGIPVKYLNNLEYIKGEVFANVWGLDMIARISPDQGKVLGWIDLSVLRAAIGPARNAEVLNGIAYDAARDRIFVTGKLWPRLFEIKIVPR